jgi:hypothetical protein
VDSVSLTGKVTYRQARDLGSNPTYTKKQLVSWPDGRSNHHGAKNINLTNTIVRGLNWREIMLDEESLIKEGGKNN